MSDVEESCTRPVRVRPELHVHINGSDAGDLLEDLDDILEHFQLEGRHGDTGYKKLVELFVSLKEKANAQS